MFPWLRSRVRFLADSCTGRSSSILPVKYLQSIMTMMITEESLLQYTRRTAMFDSALQHLTSIAFRHNYG